MIRNFCCAFFALTLFGLTSCQTTSTHLFANPALNWQSKIGQLAYKGPRLSLIGEVLVRYSSAGDFEFTFTKGPGVTLMNLREDAQFASAEGPLARGRWAGPRANAPARLRGWFELNDKIRSGGEAVQFSAGAESFNLRF